jgi:predicted dehydrogenase
MKLGGGALLDIGIYPAFLSLFLLGYPTGIEATSIFSPTGSDITTSFVLKYDEMATALLNCTVAADTQSEAIIYGTLGKIVISSRFHEAKTITLHQNGKDPEIMHFDRPTYGYFYEIEEVNNCIIMGKKESDLMSLSLSRQLIHLLDKIRQKAGITYP